MKTSKVIRDMVAVILMFLVNTPGAAAQSNTVDYHLGPGDVVRIEVFGESDLQKEVPISEIGVVSFPLIGEVRLGGLTVSKSAELIALKLDGRFLVNPRVTITIIQYRKFFVSGEVRSPGGYPFQPGLTVRSAISFAGGLKERASKRKIYVIREKDLSKIPVSVHMKDPVGPGDIVLVEQALF